MHFSFTAALFTIAKIQKQLKYPSMDEWIKTMRYIEWNIIQTFRKMKSCRLGQCEWALRSLHQVK